MTRLIDEDYFTWLASQIELPRSGRTYYDMLYRMHSLEFVWTVPNDDNRVQDGLDLRREYEMEVGTILGRESLDGASVLEVLIGLSRRVAFTAGGDAPRWAWKLIQNLHLQKMSDPLSARKADQVDEILEALVWRTYETDGQGGFFPLEHAQDDQRKVEIWYQMNVYVMENSR